MADDAPRNGLGQPGQRTSEATGGYGANIREPLAHLRLLLLRRAMEGLYVTVYAPIIVGPWIAAVYVPLAYAYAAPRVEHWFWPDDATERVAPGSLIAIGILALAVVAFLPAPYRDWWPLRVVWSAWSPRWIWVRAVALLLPWIAWRREVGYIDSRQRQEIAVPTLSGVAYAQPQAHQVRVPGVHNPFLNPDLPALPAPAPQVTRALFWRPDSGGTNGARIVDCPATIANGMQLEELAHLVLDQGISPTRSQVMRRGIFSDPGWRAFVEWASNAGLMLKTGSASSAPYVMTPEGEAWLRTVVEGEPA